MMNQKMKKTALMAAMATVMAAAMITTATIKSSAKVSFDYTSSESTSETKTVKDSNGKEYEVTHTIETEDGNTIETYTGVPMEIYNESPDNITGFYIVNVDTDDWGNSAFGKNTLEAGQHATGLTMSYSTNKPVLKVRVETEDGSEITFDNLDLTKLDDPTHMDLTISGDVNTGEYSMDMQ